MNIMCHDKLILVGCFSETMLQSVQRFSLWTLSQMWTFHVLNDVTLLSFRFPVQEGTYAVAKDDGPLLRQIVSISMQGIFS